MIRFAIGFIVGALVVAYYPTAGTEVRSITNKAAKEVQSATEPSLLEKLEKDVLSDLRK